MKLKYLAVELSLYLGVPPEWVVETHRALREGFAQGAVHQDGVTLPRDFLNRDVATMLVGKPGPGGGLAVDAYVVALFVAAYAVNCPPREVAAKTLELMAAKSRGCGLTNKRKFGDALALILADKGLAARVGSIQISYDRGFAEIFHGPAPWDELSETDEPGRTFFEIPNARRRRGGAYRLTVIPFDVLAGLARFASEPDFGGEMTKAKAKVPS